MISRLLGKTLKYRALLNSTRRAALSDRIGNSDPEMPAVMHEEEDILQEIQEAKTVVHAQLGGSVDFRNFSKLLSPNSLNDIQTYIENSGSLAREILGLLLKLTTHMMKRANAAMMGEFKNSPEIKKIFNNILDIICDNGNDSELTDFYVFLSNIRGRLSNESYVIIPSHKKDELIFKLTQRIEAKNYDLRALLKLATAASSMGDRIYLIILRYLILELKNQAVVDTLENFFYVKIFGIIASNDFPTEHQIIFNLMMEYKDKVLALPMRDQAMIYGSLLRLTLVNDQGKNQLMRLLADRIKTVFDPKNQSNEAEFSVLISNISLIHDTAFRSFLIKYTIDLFLIQETSSYQILTMIFNYVSINYHQDSLCRQKYPMIKAKISELHSKNPLLIRDCVQSQLLSNAKCYNTYDLIVDMLSDIIITEIKNSLARGENLVSAWCWFLNEADLRELNKMLEDTGKYLPGAVFCVLKIISYHRGIEPPREYSSERTIVKKPYKYFYDKLYYMPFHLSSKAQTLLYEDYKTVPIKKEYLTCITYAFPDYTDELLVKFYKKDHFLESFDSSTDGLMSERLVEKMLQIFEEKMSKHCTISLSGKFSLFVLRNVSFHRYQQKHFGKVCQAAISMIEKSRDEDKNTYKPSVINLIKIWTLWLIKNEFYMLQYGPIKKLLGLILDIGCQFKYMYLIEFNRLLIRHLIPIESSFQRFYLEYVMQYKNKMTRDLLLMDHAFLFQRQYGDSEELQALDKSYDKMYQGILLSTINNHSGLCYAVKVLNKSNVEILEALSRSDLHRLLKNDWHLRLLNIAMIRCQSVPGSEIIDHIINVYESFEGINFYKRDIVFILTRTFNKNQAVLTGYPKLVEFMLKLINSIDKNKLWTFSDFNIVFNFLFIVGKLDVSVIKGLKLSPQQQFYAINLFILYDVYDPVLDEMIEKNRHRILVSNTLSPIVKLEYFISNLSAKPYFEDSCRIIIGEVPQDIEVYGYNLNYSLLWLKLNRESLYQLIEPKIKKPIRLRFFNHDVILKLQRLLESIGVNSLLHVTEEELLVCEIMTDKFVLTTESRGKLKKEVLKNIYPNKKIITFKRAEINELISITQIERFFLCKEITKTKLNAEERGNISSMYLYSEEIAALQASDNDPELDKVETFDSEAEEMLDSSVDDLQLVINKPVVA